VFPGDRSAIRRSTVLFALALLHDAAGEAGGQTPNGGQP
jgi:hypothetical protein